MSRLQIKVSPAEYVVLVELVRDGADNETIARRLRRNRQTVSSHLKSVYQKAATNNRTELALALARKEIVLEIVPLKRGRPRYVFGKEAQYRPICQVPTCGCIGDAHP